MALADPYVTVEEFQQHVDASGTDQAERFASLLDAAKERITEVTGRNFNSTESDVVRYFDGDGSNVLEVDDLISLTKVELDEDGSLAWATDLLTTGILLEPHNEAEAGVAKPYTSLRLTSGSVRTAFTAGPKTVKVTATWGWSAVPALIQQLTIKHARDLFDFNRIGAAMQVAIVEGGVPMRSDTWAMWGRVERLYARPGRGTAIPVIY